MILTGAPAINKVLGQEVYTSNLQLGGTQIMYRNGVSHMTVKDDFEGVSKIVEWLAFVPEKKNSLIPIGPMIDPWDRDIVCSPSPCQPYDVRCLIEGVEMADGFQSGFFDRDSFVESLGGWAKTVVVGRARLGGIPMGVIAVETRTVENITPANPANGNSTEQIAIEAGGVWYPNSAFKTAQAIKDFNHGEQLPLMVLANWRGFSGGQKDMYDEILKYGSFILDALIKYEQPVFVYIPPFAQLRGGSWVVLDPVINREFMEMYADEDARCGILEPEGIVNVRYRQDKQLKTMARLDPEYGALCRKLADPSLSKEEVDDTKAKATAREQLLLPIYLQVSLQFADLHDRAGCMTTKNLIRNELKWRDARRFFYWRVLRRVLEEHILKRIATSSKNPRINRGRNLAFLAAWTGIPNFSTADREVALWYEENRKLVDEKIECLKAEEVAYDIASLLRVDRKGGLKGVQLVLSMLSAKDREEALQFLN
jgi:acetyl-CoA carboxylase/biotin carboxylase 1